MIAPRPFTDAENAAALEAYAKGSWPAVYAIFPGVNKSTITSRVMRLPGWQGSRMGWSTGDLSTLIDLWNRSFPAADIARMMGRSKNAIELKISEQRKMGTLLRRRQAPAFTEGQKRVLTEQVDFLINSLAQRLGRSPNTIRSWVARAAITAGKRNRARKLRVA